MKKVEWSWVKGHRGHLSNECADMLATKGLDNETPFSNVHPINEDVDTQVYEFRLGEETRVDSDWKGYKKPECTYVMKDSENLQEYLSREPTPESTPWPSAPASAPVSDAQED
jgi:hypothetical protein